MATISSTRLQAVQRFTASATAPDHGQTQKRGFKTKRDAERSPPTVEVIEAEGEYVAPALGRVTVAELAPDWLARKHRPRRRRTYRMLESAWRVHVQPRWGTVRVADVDTLGIEEWIADMLDKGAGATTVLRAHGVLSGILADAVKAQAASGQPGEGCGEPAAQDSASAASTCRPTTCAGWPTSPGEHRALVLVLAYCGVRWGEAIALRVRDVEFLRRRLTVSRTPSSSASTTRSGRPRAARHDRCRCPSSCSTSCRRLRRQAGRRRSGVPGAGRRVSPAAEVDRADGSPRR